MTSSDRGSATVQAIAVVALLSLLAFTFLQIALAVSLRQRAAAAADLAALAASRASVEGDGDPCVRARDVSEANGGRLRHCRMDADVATITVRATGPRWSIGRWTAEQRARAAPAWYLE